MSENHIDELSGVATTGHEWDGIRELNNPLPRWWLWTFYATILFAIGYCIAYPAWPLISSSTTGMLGWSSRAAVGEEMKAADAARAAYSAEIAARPVDEILADEGLRTVAVSAGSAAFKVNCVQCHGSGAEGSKGFPNLNDDDWLWGGKAEEIRQTIAHGIRFAQDAETRDSVMPAFADMLKGEEIRQVATFVKSLSGTVANAASVAPGKDLFAANCAACHGEDGKGSREFGAPDLTDAIWLYGSSEAEIAAQIRAPHMGVMPAWQERLGETTVKELAVFVHSLGGGER
ncbi:cytochrome-c oxidase, cbb3-type subunit III [Ensifer soli]|uniref:cytochrome-c oxidase, cbb3-type subunit III n=1 Tax=Ciceribacter sp. sgz301302 TaxID=3342379 RepID=UPI0035B8E47D